jgi:hypothetical protein
MPHPVQDRRPSISTDAFFACALCLIGLPAPSASAQPPLSDTSGSFQGLDLGLYGQWQNAPPEPHLSQAIAAAYAVQPLDPHGWPSARGHIGFLAIGQSTTSAHFAAFTRLLRTQKTPIHPRLKCINGATDGMVAETWASSNEPWNIALARVRDAGLTPQQVQVVWIKLTHIHPARYGPFPRHAEIYAGLLAQVVRQAKLRFPNLKLAFLSSRVYQGYGPQGACPEPYAYETAFGIRLLIQAQIHGDPSLNHLPDRGLPVVSPVLLWGPYLWAQGPTPRESDGLSWLRADFIADGIHPSSKGSQKIGRVLLNFFSNTPFSRIWFLSPKALEHARS